MAKDQYHQEPCEEKREDVATKKDLLKACYKEVEEEILKGKLRILLIVVRTRKTGSLSLIFQGGQNPAVD